MGWKRHWQRVSSVSALVLLVTSAIFATQASIAAAAPLKVTERLSNANPSTSSTLRVTVCWSNAKRGDVVELDEQSPSTLSWRAVDHATIHTGTGCDSWARTSGSIGKYLYRGDVHLGRSVLGMTPVVLERTYGTISAAAFFTAEWGCQGGGSVSTGTQSYAYFCSLNAGPEAQSDYLTFSRPTTCRSLTLSMVATGDVNGNPADHSTMVVEIQQDNLVQPALFVDNTLKSFTYHLDDHAAALNIWDSPGNSDGDAAYFLTNGSTASCSSRAGV
jgi:hypothetical protein